MSGEPADGHHRRLRPGHHHTPQDVLTYVDGALLVDLWDSLVLPRDVRAAWSDVVDSALDVTPSDLQLGPPGSGRANSGNRHRRGARRGGKAEHS